MLNVAEEMKCFENYKILLLLIIPPSDHDPFQQSGSFAVYAGIVRKKSDLDEDSAAASGLSPGIP